jgi:4-amino-4-deoxy-L-arabinose transferase-like glycosyltransferase
METPTQGRSQPRSVRWLLVVVLAWSALLRFWLISVDPDPSRLWDERFTVANVTTILARGAFEPQNYWYGSLSYLPQLAVVAGWEGARSAFGAGLPALLTTGGRGFTPAGYVVGRGLQALYGLLSIALVFLLGRRLFSPWVGLGGAFLLAASPRHVHASSVLKPDVLLALLTLAAFALSVEAIHRLRLAPYLISGVALGLATATKLNGGALALPLALGTALRVGPFRRWLHLAAAGVASIAAYVLLNPQLARIWEAFQKNRHWYAQHAPEDRPQALAEMAGYLFDPAFHGPVVATLALVGAGVLARRTGVAGLRSAEGAAWAAFLSFPLLYVGVYLAVTTRAKENHFLQVLPFTALLAALAVEAGWRRVVARWPAAGVRRAAVTALAVGAVLVAWPTASFAYSAAVPRTEEQALRWVRGRLPAPLTARMVIYDPDLSAVPELRRLPAAIRTPGNLAALPGAELALADAVVVRRSFLAAAGAEEVLRYVTGLPADAVLTFAGGAFSARGPEVVAAVRPFDLVSEAVGEPAQVALRPLRRRPGVLRGRVPPPPAGAAWVSYSLALPLPVAELGRARLRVRGEAVPLVFADLRRNGSLALTPRLPAGRGAAVIEVEIADPPPGAAVSATAFGWAANVNAEEEP